MSAENFLLQRIHIIRLLPGQIGLAEVTVVAGLAVDRTAQAQAADRAARPVASAMTMVVPEPPKGSSTTALLM